MLRLNTSQVLDYQVMANDLNQTELRRYAVLGAETRLLALTEEVAAIHRVFPELRNGGRPDLRNASENGSSAGGTQARDKGRRKGGMSAAQRRAVSERMRKYWAGRRDASRQQGNKSAAKRPRAAARGVAAKKATRGPRTMSPAARKRISEAQKARWAKQRAEKGAA